MGALHDFYECRAQSHAAEDLPLWREIYERAFGDCTIISHRADGEHQRAGIDRSIILPDATRLLIDEKIRGRNRTTNKVYADIALEFEHRYTNGRVLPGWVNKPLRCHYIAYAIAPLGKAYLLPVIQLQAAWRKNQETWKSNFNVITARNHGYSTLSLTIPVADLFRAIGDAFRVNFTPTETPE